MNPNSSKSFTFGAAQAWAEGVTYIGVYQQDGGGVCGSWRLLSQLYLVRQSHAGHDAAGARSCNKQGHLLP